MITKFKLYLTKLNISEGRIFEQNEQDWKLTLDISKIWKDSLYENVNDLTSFNDQYINFLNKQKDLIIKQTSVESWNKLQELTTRLTENKDKITESASVWDDIYDWADSNFVQIIVQKNEQNVQSETETIQDNVLKKDF